uniref:Uncharacterized protein n=1 Tax=viral metagenome TaxID=1070528 RepID=A0A6M3IYA6_9ZZZZ
MIYRFATIDESVQGYVKVCRTISDADIAFMEKSLLDGEIRCLCHTDLKYDLQNLYMFKFILGGDCYGKTGRFFFDCYPDFMPRKAIGEHSVDFLSAGKEPSGRSRCDVYPVYFLHYRSKKIVGILHCAVTSLATIKAQGG